MDSLPVGSEVVLVVDDDPDVRYPIVRLLRTLGYMVLEAQNGEHALSVMDAHHAPVHLVISDVMMPEMNGSELATLLRSAYPNLRILLMSGMGASVFEKAGEMPENTHFIDKPFQQEQLATRIRAILDADWEEGND